MKKPLAIIKRRFSTEGFPVDREWALRRFLDGIPKMRIYQYGNTVFTVDKQGTVHLFRDGGKVSLLEATRRFMEDTRGQALRAPIKNPRVMQLAELFGWRPVRDLAAGYKLYEVRK